MKKELPLKTKASESKAVDDHIAKVTHPLKDGVIALRKIILASDKSIGEEIKWNAPAFFYMREMDAFNPKEYKRHIVVFNLSKTDAIRLIFPTGARIKDDTGLLTGDYTDGRRLVIFKRLDEIKSRKKDLQQVIRQWLEGVND